MKFQICQIKQKKRKVFHEFYGTEVNCHLQGFTFEASHGGLQSLIFNVLSFIPCFSHVIKLCFIIWRPYHLCLSKYKF